MNEAQYEKQLQMVGADTVAGAIAELEQKIQLIVGRREKLKLDPEKMLLEEKQEQLEETLAKYGQVDCSTLSIEQIALTFVRLQGEEAIARKDIKVLESKKSEHDLQKCLAIAQRVLTEKGKDGGRTND